MSKITGFTHGPTSSGHMTWYAAILACGHWHYSKGWTPFPADVQAGMEVDCETCTAHAAAESRLEALEVSQVYYMRFSTRFAYPDQGIFGQYHAYTRDSSSPTGVRHLASFPATKNIDAIIDRRRICTLSPTEGR
jgi:hypothetical protein